MSTSSTQTYTSAISEIKHAILQSRYRAASLANGEMLMLYFRIGGYISQNSRKNKWGSNAIETIAAQLQKELPGLRGFAASNLKNMRVFYEEWMPLLNSPVATGELAKHSFADAPAKSKLQISPVVTGELQKYISSVTTDDLKSFFSIGFTHHCEIFTKVKSPAARLFYIQKCATEFWSVEKLRYNIKSDLYGKQGKLQNNFTKAISNADLRSKALQSFKDEYLWDFINIEDPDDEPDERVIEQSIVQNIQKFIMSLGQDFSFMGRQFRLEVDETEYFIDLLFFNRRLQCLVAIELKRGEFKPEYAGKLNFYLSALDDSVKLPSENPSIGIILCKSKKKTTVEYAFRDTSKPMGVATYLLASKLPAKYKNIIPDANTLKKLL